MMLGKVVGNVVATAKLPILQGLKIMVVQPIDAVGKPRGQTLLAFDMVQAGIGDTVLVIDEGNSCRTILGDPQAPIRMLIVGIVDEIEQ